MTVRSGAGNGRSWSWPAILFRGIISACRKRPPKVCRTRVVVDTARLISNYQTYIDTSQAVQFGGLQLKGNCNRTYEKKERQIAKFTYSCTFFSKPFVLLHRVYRRWSASSTNATPDLRDFRGFVCREAGSDEGWLTLLSTIAVSSQVDLPVSILPSFAFELKKKLVVAFLLLRS